MKRLLGPLGFLLALAAPAPGMAAVAPQEARTAHPGVLAAFNSGQTRVRVLVGMEEPPAIKTLSALLPGEQGQAARRAARRSREETVAASAPAGTFDLRRTYDNFTMAAGTVTADGLKAIANRPDVRWVVLDRKRRPLQQTPQAAQQLIGSDQANALGYTGSGQVAAIIDTGVDYTASDMGGGGFPNSKVIGGYDFADHDSDPADCEGHGTEVADVLAGSQGVAPDAKIVALKVFQTAGCASDSSSANDTDILAAIDWAVTNRSTYGITVLNLSLGGQLWTDSNPHGFCDAEDPAYTSAIGAARAAGMLTFVASGNENVKNQIDDPACVSPAVSVGAVYASNQGSVAWATSPSCTDSNANQDTVTCFSNSSNALTLLAPGAFWTAETTHSGIDRSFAGTSAAAPAAAGVAAILQQARPGLSPTAIVETLQATGHPVLDAANNLVKARVDAIGAVNASPQNLNIYSGPGISIPDNSASGASATLNVTGVSGYIDTVAAHVIVNHPDISQLTVTLTGPDGTSDVLYDKSGQAGQALDAFYGLTDQPQDSLTVFHLHPADGVWTLQVVDSVAGSTGTLIGFSLDITPTALEVTSVPLDAAGEVVPVVGHTQGSKFFQSDVRIFNPSATASRTVDLYYTPTGQTGQGDAVRLEVTAAQRQVLSLPDVLFSNYGLTSAFGTLAAVSTDPNFIVSSRAYTSGCGGSVGTYVPGRAASGGVTSASGAATANGLVQNIGFHSNVGASEVSGQPATVHIVLLDGNGAVLGSTDQLLLPNSNFQQDISTLFPAIAGRDDLVNLRADFTVTSATGRIVPYATVVDNTTGDGSFVFAIAPSSAATDWILPQAAHVHGANDTFFETDLHVTNPSGAAVTVLLTADPRQGATNLAPVTRTETLAPGQTLERLDVLSSEFGLTNDLGAVVRVHPVSPAAPPLIVTSRTFTPSPSGLPTSCLNGSLGFFVAGVDASTALSATSGRTMAAIHLDQTAATRSNFGFAEVDGIDSAVVVTVRDSSGNSLGAQTIPLPANGSYQGSISDIIGSATQPNVYVEFAVISGGAILPYATAIDNVTGDAIYVPGAIEP